MHLCDFRQKAKRKLRLVLRPDVLQKKSKGAAAPSRLGHMISREAWTKENKSFLKERLLILEWLSDLVDDSV